MAPSAPFVSETRTLPPLYDILDIEGQLELLPIEAMRSLARHFTDSALGRRCRGERNERLRNLAQTYEGSSGEALAELVQLELARYAESAWKYQQGRPLSAGARVRRQLQHRVLTLTDGRPLSVPTIKRALAGSKIGPVLSRDRHQPISRTEEGDDAEGNSQHGRRERRHSRSGSADRGREGQGGRGLRRDRTPRKGAPSGI